MLDLIALHQALLVEEHGSFRLAARVLSIKPSVVSRRVRGLEDAIGVSLFHRTSRGVKPTVAGASLLQRGRVVLAEIHALQRIAIQNGTGSEGRLSIGIVASIASGVARQLLYTFLSSHPGVVFDSVEGSTRSHLSAVRALELDVAIVAGTPASPGCEVEPMWRERVVVSLSNAHPLAKKAVILWEDLEGERFIVSRADPGPEVENYIIRGLADLGKNPEVAHYTVQRETLLALVGLGQGLSLVAEAEAGVNYPGVTFRPLENEEISFSMVWSQKNDNPVLRRFISSARKYLALRPELPPA